MLKVGSQRSTRRKGAGEKEAEMGANVHKSVSKGSELRQFPLRS